MFENSFDCTIHFNSNICSIVEGKHHDAPWGERNHHGCKKNRYDSGQGQGNAYGENYQQGYKGGYRGSQEEEVCAMMKNFVSILVIKKH